MTWQQLMALWYDSPGRHYTDWLGTTLSLLCQTIEEAP